MQRLSCDVEVVHSQRHIQTDIRLGKHDTFAFAITLDDRAIGSIGVFRQGNIHSRTAEMGYYIAEKYWGQGIVTKAVKLIL